ncbi:hypothetical protein [Lacipirellula parvula]|uniref:Uncharacterized protein n=1 Tax=Lacipirellula parvula TaxID=2650471 RepID=A0A5K7X9S8_9BACT|nr:hypothetical protein [Lacipirellula parvula]BBO31511.1 hypothetical protein PLANPX_1123 [Lacipirellula parvula]
MTNYARYRAPAESGQKLIAPPWGDLCRIVAGNVAWRRESSLTILGRPLAEFAAEARAEVLARAEEYISTYAASSAPIKGAARLAVRAEAKPCGGSHVAPLIVTGHQPELVHPGVWVKNFAAAALCASKGAVSLNLVIDGDACRSTAIRVPAGTLAEPRWESVDFDGPAAGMPWEQRTIVDAERWQSFPARVGAATAGMLSERMLDDWWPLAMERAAATGRIGLGLAQARHLAEIEWGSHNLELPQSGMCQTDAFRRFTLHLFNELPRFVDSYNAALDEYRQVHRLRNHAHPVPNLAVDGQWQQAPYWVWSNEIPTRRPVFVKRDGGGFVVTDRQTFERRLPCVCDDSGDRAVAELADWEAQGIKLRSRALITTMFARLAVADLFIHGIGGAKYDEATDAICERFFATAPPAFAAISGTLHLPIARTADAAEPVAALRQRLRDLQYHPEQDVDFAAANGEAGAAVASKRQWIATAKTAANAAERHHAIATANAALQPEVAGIREQLEQRIAAASEQSRTNRVLNSREYASCLFPRKSLEQFLLDFPS